MLFFQSNKRALITIAQTMQQMVHRPADLVARYGGEEFSLLLAKPKGRDRYCIH
ncbi:MAG: diguanylate cyclase [Nostoc sp.]